MATSDQLRAQRAYERVSAHVKKTVDEKKKYKSFATSFPALIHQCGLAQAIAYAQGKAPETYQNDLADVLQTSIEAFAEEVRSAPLATYQHHSRTALSATTWLKRYAEALLKTEKKAKEAADE